MSRILRTILVSLALAACSEELDYFPDTAERGETAPQLTAARPAGEGEKAGKTTPTVRVEPVAGVAAPMANLLAESVAENLKEMKVRVSAQGDVSSSYVLAGRAEPNWKDVRAPFVVIIRWLLVDAAGQPATSFIQGVRGKWWQWENGDPQLIRMVGLGAAKPVADMLIVKDEPPPPPELMGAGLMVMPVKGAPGDGNRLFTIAIKEALRATDVSVTEDPRQAAFVLEGRVASAATPDGGERIVVEWTVMTSKGRELGKATQESTVPGGMLQGSWNRIAIRAAAEAVEGIERIITGSSQARQTPSSPASPPPPPLKLPHVPGRAMPPP
ncbi:MAG: hypothetical protein V3R66_06030 [Rhodospirillales bacterium]